MDFSVQQTRRAGLIDRSMLRKGYKAAVTDARALELITSKDYHFESKGCFPDSKILYLGILEMNGQFTLVRTSEEIAKIKTTRTSRRFFIQDFLK